MEANDNAQYAAAVNDDGIPSAPWKIPKEEEHTDFKAKMLQKQSNALSENEVSKNALGKYLLEEANGDWEGSKSQIEYINMNWIKENHVCLDDFEEFRVLGRGGFGMVKGVCRKTSGAMFANKIQNKRRMKAGKAVSLAFEEREALCSVTSPFVVGLHYAFHDAENAYLILELLSGGDLQFHLNKEKKFTEDVTKYFIASTLQGIGALHDEGWVYRDLKPENILLCADGHCKITDLGLATKVGDGITGSAGTRGFYAPEMITKDKNGKRQTYTEVVDFWSLGCVFYAFIDGATPFYNEKKVKKFADDFNEAINEATRTMTVEYDSDNFSKGAEKFARALLTRNPEQRLGAKGWREIERHDFFSGFDFDSLRSAAMMPPFVPEEILNAKDSNLIGEHEKEKKVKWEDADESQFKNWDFLNDARFENEVVASLEWAKENGDLRQKRKSAACTIM